MSVAESVAVVGSAGPVRAVVGALRGDSLLLDFRRSDLALVGAVGRAEDRDAELLRFLLEPWRFEVPLLRESIGRAESEPAGNGWRLRGALGAGGGGHRRFLLTLAPRGEPLSLALRLGPGESDTLLVRYGAPSRYAAGRLPRWVEWSWGDTRARLTIERHVAWEGPSPRTGFRPEPGDTVVPLDGPRGRAVLRDLFGIGESGEGEGEGQER